jgi:hypothetical protein
MTSSRRAFLGQISSVMATAGAINLLPQATRAADPASPPRKLAIIATEWRHGSHAWHMAERFLVGYPREGRWHRPPFEVVSAYVDQVPENDLSRQRAAEFGFTIYPSIAAALRAGGERLAVDAVLIIGEHGKYPVNEYGQTQYPRYEFFRQVCDVYRADGRVAPVFSDKHLSWKWDWAAEMVALSRELTFGFCAGSSLPVTWRMPSVDLPHGARVREAMCVAAGSPDSYDFHVFETLQCMLERRQGGETGVAWVEAFTGDAFWKAYAAGSWDQGGWDPDLVEACLCRSQTLEQPETFSHRHPTAEQIRAWVKEPLAYRVQYRDGTRACHLRMNGLVSDFTFAARLPEQNEILSTLFYLPPRPNVYYSTFLMHMAETTFTTGVSPTPIDRTLLTSGLVEAGLKSVKQGQRLETPHLAVKYAVAEKSLFARD